MKHLEYLVLLSVNLIKFFDEFAENGASLHETLLKMQNTASGRAVPGSESFAGV